MRVTDRVADEGREADEYVLSVKVSHEGATAPTDP